MRHSACCRRRGRAGARALLLREVSLDGAAMKAFNTVLRGEGLRARILNWHLRASLDATRDADELLREALSAKKLKELRRQRHRLAEHGDVALRRRAHHRRRSRPRSKSS